jgi:plasmid stability protein
MAVRRALRVLAAQYGRGAEAEVRDIVEWAASPAKRVHLGDSLAAPRREVGSRTRTSQPSTGRGTQGLPRYGIAQCVALEPRRAPAVSARLLSPKIGRMESRRYARGTAPRY